MNTENNDTIFTCPVICWLLAAGAGLILIVILASGMGLGAFWTLLFSIALFVAVGWFLTGHYCEARASSASHTIAASRQSVAAVDSTGQSDLATTPEAPKPAPRAKAKPAAKKAAPKTAAKKTAAAKKASKPAAKKLTAKPAAKSAKPAAKKAPAKSAAKKTTTAKTASKPAAAKAKTAAKPATKPAAKKTVAKTASKPAAKPAAKKPAAKKAAKPASKVAAKPGKPAMLKTARAGGADNLKQIKGVGPALEKELHKQGFFHFDQIADWNAAQVKWADDNLKGVRDRVSRDGWVAQAKVLAKGGETEFSKRVKKGDVY